MVVILMGVSGSGKTTIGLELAKQLGWEFYDGDDFHPRANIEKMAHDIPLNDQDRADWLAALAELIRKVMAAGKSAFIACSALKSTYRDVLCVDPRQVMFVYLKGSYDLILTRMEHRHGHYMKPEMLLSQFADLQEPSDALVVDISQSPQQIADEIIRKLSLR